MSEPSHAKNRSELTKELSPIEAAAIAFVKRVQANDEAEGDTAQPFGADLFKDEELAWHDLTAAVAGWEILYG